MENIEHLTDGTVTRNSLDGWSSMLGGAMQLKKEEKKPKKPPVVKKAQVEKKPEEHKRRAGVSAHTA